MRKIFQILIVLLTITPFTTQGQPPPKIPETIRGCLDLSDRIKELINTEPIVNGKIQIHRAGEVTLFAVVNSRVVDGRSLRSLREWRIYDNEDTAREVSALMYTRDRQRGSVSWKQTIVYTEGTNPEGCFIVDKRSH
jgi:hypothetical protein